MRECLGSIPIAGKLDSGYHLSDVGEISSNSHCGRLLLKIANVNRRHGKSAGGPRVLDNVKLHLTCGLTAIETEISTEYLTAHDIHGIFFMILFGEYMRNWHKRVYIVRINNN